MIRWTTLVIATWLGSAPFTAAGNPGAPVETDTAEHSEHSVHSDTHRTTAQLDREDMEIIAVMETLQLMDLAESMEMVTDMDVLLEETLYEDQN